MVAPRFRSRRFRRVNVRTPGGNTVLHHERRKPGKPQCAKCGEYLKGVIRGTISKVQKASKTQRRPERPYGGMFCSRCTRKLMVSKARAMVMKDG